ncbi:hypothetical protein Clacol_005996 [Clathrus columnatus]|uniref:beta-glucosidase n=1 Tax=Clathrus columnatus TaxID=1419009 RepID=A0AAV5AGE9_9AGAM|nr:hypothetical protein Clacol_005996 [Clathrus columnatus]
MSSTDFATASIPELLSKLTKEEKIHLLAAPDWWHTQPIARLGIPSAKMSDGPNGVRGESFFLLSPAQCLPCSTSLASTFDTELINATGAFLAEEAKLKSATILLAPTCNIQRSPLGGRSFESFSEDPFLSGTCAAAYVNGLQSNGVAATIKHFVANDQEHERMGSSSNLSERALREIYLYPFMIAQRDAKPWAYMTAYNRLNGVHCSENPRLLTDILRREWGFDGLVMSDWFGTYSVAENINAGLSLEMPGPPRWRTSLLVNHSLTSQKVSLSTIDTRVSEVLRFVQKLSKVSPEIIFNPQKELSREASPSIRSFTRKLASSGIILLRNENGVLPIKSPKSPGTKLKIAVMGPNAKARNISGGGSANLKPSYVVTPYQGIVDNKPENVEIKYTVGCYAQKYLPSLQEEMASPSNPSKSGFWHCAFFNHDPKTNTPLSTPLAEYVLNDNRILLNDFLPEGITDEWSMVVKGIFTPVDYTGVFEFGLTVAGRGKLFVNDQLVVDNWTKQRQGDFFDGRGTLEETGLFNVTAGKSFNIRIEYINTPPPGTGESGGPQASPTFGLRLGGAPKIDADEAIKEAVQLASQSDVVVIITGLSHEWESEGYDRPTLDLPGRQNELIEAVAGVNKNVVVVVQAGSATTMPWNTEVSSILQAWYSGNESGNAISDILYGHTNPSGKLPLTFPKRLKDVPSYLNYGSEQGQVYYREDLFVGYKWYQAREIECLYPFGFGLSYTTFSYSSSPLNITQKSSPSNLTVTLSFTLTNTGSITGSETPQVYISLPKSSPSHPIPTTPEWQLRGFSKIKDLKPGEKRNVEIVLDKYAFSFWDVTIGAWRVYPGKYKVVVGSSSASVDFVLGGEVVIKEGDGFVWEGL